MKKLDRDVYHRAAKRSDRTESSFLHDAKEANFRQISQCRAAKVESGCKSAAESCSGAGDVESLYRNLNR